MTLTELRQLPQDAPSQDTLSVSVQLTKIQEKQTASGKPYYDLELSDAEDRCKVKIWSDTEAFEFCQNARLGDLCQMRGYFYVNDFGLNVNQPSLRILESEEADRFLQGSPERAAEMEACWKYVLGVFEDLEDPRLRLLTTTCLSDLESKWKRAAAARSYHHARRGGLLEHTAQMLRSAEAIAPLYSEIWPDLLYTGVLFHDIGKCWENDYPEQGFVTQPIRMGELLGHISIGVEVVNRYWNRLREQEPEIFDETQLPPSDLIKEHLLHLIISHHGQLEFGSPVTPKIPEAWALHYIDNLDARMEMLRGTYQQEPAIGKDLYDPQRPLSGYQVRPISEYL
ncbi:MAG: HD domain-containing protein [Verrucomicrobiota bacterium]